MHALRKVFNYKIEQIEDQNDYIIDIIQIYCEISIFNPILKIDIATTFTKRAISHER